MQWTGSQTRTLVCLLALGFLVAAGAHATKTDGSPQPKPPAPAFGPPEPFFDNFDAYADGSDMHGQGGWKGWDNNPAFGALVTSANSNSPPHSVDINGNADLVHEFAGFTSGQWTLGAWSYVPSGFNGISYFIALNTYSDGGTKNWSTQVRIDGGTGMIVSEFDNNMLPIVFNTWTEWRVEIDLDLNSQSIYYDNMLLVTKSWTEGVSGGGAVNIGAVDLFANSAPTVFWDDVSLCDTMAGCPEVPALEGWGLGALALLVVAIGIALLRHRRLIRPAV